MKKNQPNQFDRLSILIGNDGIDTLKKKKVLVVGLGGVGGYVVESLSRSGIGTLGLVDYDIVDITNINRQIIALHSTIGQKKVDLFKTRISDINKECNVICYDVFLTKDNYNDLFNIDYDFIIDCCDSIEAKKALLLEATKRNIPFISCMGTANKMDPSKLQIIELVKTSYDPIAKIMRKFVKDNNIKEKIFVLASSEQPIKNGTKLGSNSFVPATAGLLISSYVIKKILGNKVI